MEGGCGDGLASQEAVSHVFDRSAHPAAGCRRSHLMNCTWGLGLFGELSPASVVPPHFTEMADMLKAAIGKVSVRAQEQRP